MIRIQNLQLRIIFSVWIIATMIFTAGYKTCFNSLLAIPSFVEPIDRLSQLIRAAETDSHRITMLDQASYWYSFNESTPDNFLHYTIKMHINR